MSVPNCATTTAGSDDESFDSEDYELLERDETNLSMMLEAEGKLSEFDASNEDWWKEALDNTKKLRSAISLCGTDSPAPITESDPEDEFVIDSDAETDKVGALGESIVSYAPLSRENSLVKSDAGDEWALAEILRRKRLKGVLYYQCLWRGCDEPTWETFEFLEDEGWAGFCEEFDKNLEVKVNSKAAADSAIPWSQTRSARLKEKKSHRSGSWLFQPAVIWPRYAETISQAVSAVGMRVVKMTNIVSDHIARRFVAHLDLDQSSAVVMCFHGTKVGSVPGIIKHGLCIPGSRPGVTVVHGSAMGVGIYTARTLGTPLTYITPNAIRVFVVAVNVAEKFTSTTLYNNSGDWIVLFNEAQVLPVFLLELEKADRSVPVTVLAAAPDVVKEEPCKESHLKTINRRGASKRDLKKQARWLKDFYNKGEVRRKN